MNDFFALASPALLALACMALPSCGSVQKSFTPEKLKKLTGGMAHAEKVDLERMMGDWIVFANIPYWAERDAHGSIERYWLDEKGRIPTRFFYRKGAPDGPVKSVQSLARVVDQESNAVWQVEFFGLVKIPYIVAAIDPGYRWALIGHPSRDLGWILSRERLSEDQYRAILAIAKQRGYDVEKFRKVPEAKPFDLPPL